VSQYVDISRSLGGQPFFIHLDNARAHYAKSAKLWLQDHNITILQHPPYSPDLAPCDFWLFGFLKGQLQGRCFGTQESLQEAILSILHVFGAPKFREVFNEWIRRLELCIERNGDYVHIDQ